MLEQYNPLNILSLIRAKGQIKKIKKYLRKQNLMILGKKYKHETKLIDILSIEYIFINKLKRKMRKQHAENFDLFIKMQAHAILASDFINEGAEKADVGYTWKNIEELIKRIKKVEPELGTLSKAHWDMANKLLKQLEKKTKKTISTEFSKAVSTGLNYLKTELEFSDRFKKGDIKFAQSFIKKHFENDDALEHLTFARVSVIYEFLINSFYNLFLEDNPFPKYPKEHLMKWAEYLSKAMQETIDDIDDIENDIERLKPTPVILRILKTGSISDGLRNTRMWNMNYFNSLIRFDVLPPIRAVEKIIRKKIMKRYRKAFRKRRKIESLIIRKFSDFF